MLMEGGKGCGGGVMRQAGEGGCHWMILAKTPPTKAPLSPKSGRCLIAELRAKNAELATLQGESPLILPTWTPRLWPACVGDWTGIPVGRNGLDELETVLEPGKRTFPSGDAPGPRMTR
jgi:hypothetical protein